MQTILLGFQYVFSDPMCIALLALGVFVGIIFGSIPGLTATLGVTLFIPFTYTMQPVQGLVMLIAVYVGGISGGLITATLINIPGTPSSIYTCFDGYPMTKKGKPAQALAIGVFCSLIGGLMIHGLQPGPLLYSQHPELVGGIMVAYFMANVVMYVMELGLMKAFVRMVNVKLSFLFPAIVACCVLGVYTLNNRMFDVWVMIIFGFVGYLLICLGIDMAPVILGFILGPLIEKYMRMALISANGNWADMFNRPVSVFFVVIAILFVVVPVIKKAVSQGKKKA